MDKIETLRSQLRGANISDDMIANGVRLTERGSKTLCAKLNCSDEELRGLIRELAGVVKDELSQMGGMVSINEDAEDRYTYETDYMDNVCLRDSKTGKEIFIQGDDAFKLLREIDQVGIHYQPLLAPYFEQQLREFVEQADVHGDLGNSGGTYNFPYKGQFACARFYISNNKPTIEVLSLVDGNGDEVPMDARTKADLQSVAWEWVDKV